MSNQAQLKVLQLCKGMTLAQATYRLELMQEFIANKKLKTRIILSGLKIGE